MYKSFFLSFFLLLAVFATRAEDYVFERGIYYRPQHVSAYADSMCVLDIARPEGATSAPVLVWFHGGGLTGGRREVPRDLMHDGLIVVGVEYRLSPQVATTEIIDDAAAAVAWTVRHIAQFGGDPTQVFIAGHSAGGYLVNMLALDKSWLKKYEVDADSLFWRMMKLVGHPDVTLYEFDGFDHGSMALPGFAVTREFIKAHLRR